VILIFIFYSLEKREKNKKYKALLEHRILTINDYY